MVGNQEADDTMILSLFLLIDVSSCFFDNIKPDPDSTKRFTLTFWSIKCLCGMLAEIRDIFRMICGEFVDNRGCAIIHNDGTIRSCSSVYFINFPHRLPRLLS